MSTKFIRPGAGSSRQIAAESGRSRFGWVVVNGFYFYWYSTKRTAIRVAMDAAKGGPFSASVRVRKAKATENGGFEM